MRQHLNIALHLMTILCFTLPDATTDTAILSEELRPHNAVINNARYLDKNDKCGQFQFIEAYYIKKMAPGTNFGLKTSKKLQLFE